KLPRALAQALVIFGMHQFQPTLDARRAVGRAEGFAEGVVHPDRIRPEVMVPNAVGRRLSQQSEALIHLPQILPRSPFAGDVTEMDRKPITRRVRANLQTNT